MSDGDAEPLPDGAVPVVLFYGAASPACDDDRMELWMKVVGSIVAPALLVFIGWRGIPAEKRTGALRVVATLFAVIVAATATYIIVTIDMTPKWTATSCEQAWQEVSKTSQASEPTLAREPFMAGCTKLTPSAADCARPSFATKFSSSCTRYADEIHAALPMLVVGK